MNTSTPSTIANGTRVDNGQGRNANNLKSLERIRRRCARAGRETHERRERGLLDALAGGASDREGDVGRDDRVARREVSEAHIEVEPCPGDRLEERRGSGRVEDAEVVVEETTRAELDQPRAQERAAHPT